MRSASTHLGFVLAALTALSGCGSDTRQAQVRVLNVSQGYGSLDLYVNNNNNTSSDDTLELQGVPYPTLSKYVGIDSGTYTADFRKTGVSSNLLTLSAEQWSDDSHQTYVGFGPNGSFGVLKISEDQAAPSSGKTDVTVLNTSTAGSVDI